MRLITIPLSHYCEKARWALEHAKVRFTEEGHAPLFHWRASLGAGGGRTVPVLVTGEAVLGDSTDILRFADAHATADRKLYPAGCADEVAALEDKLDEELGPHARRLGYYHALPHRDFALGLLSQEIPAWEARAVAATFPLARAVLRRGLRIDDEGARISLAKVERVWADVEARLADGRRFLAGDRFSAADLTFAALASPLVWPSEHPRGPLGTDAPAPLAALRERFAGTAAGAFVLRLYREHRAAP